MKKKAQFSIQVLTFLILVFAGPTFAQGQPEADRTGSPYFFVKSENPSTDKLPLKSTEAYVKIAGVIADVRITQVYKNEGTSPLEGIYVFPASSRAAIYGMKMQVGNRMINAEVQEKNKARQTYETARSNGQRTSLLEQQRPNVFQMNVANIMPGDEIKVILNYTELMVAVDGTYEFVYPTVVGPRYTGESSKKEGVTASSYQKAEELPFYDFDLNVWLSAGMPLQDVSSTSHQISTEFQGTSAVKINLDPSEKNGGNRDFILQYKLAGDKIQEGLLLYKHEDENYFLMMVQPPKKIKTEQIPPREYIFVVDVSGSMRGFPLDISKKLMRNLVTNLRPTDQFNVMLFASTAATMAAQSLAATTGNIEKAVTFMDSRGGGGGTNLLSALDKALKLPRSEESVSRSVVVITDGYISVEAEAFDLIRNHLDDANLFAFGIGSGVNRHLIEGMAHVGQGEPIIVTQQTEAPEAAAKFRKYIQSPVLSRVKTNFGKFAAYDIEPSTVPDVLAERPVIVFGKYKGNADGTIVLKGYSGKKKFRSTLDVSAVKPDQRNAALRYLWARERIRLLDDYNRLNMDQDRINEITQLGLDYNLMTAYTSFVAVDKQVANSGNKLKSVNQPLPLPQGVPNSAVGFSPGIEMIVFKGFNKGVTASFSSVSIWRMLTLVLGTCLIVIGWRKLS